MSGSKVAVYLLAAWVVCGQTDRGIISGTVTDSSGAAIPEATVTAMNVNTKVTRTTVSNSSGLYTIPALSPGTYRVRVSKDGFKVAEQTGIVLNAGSTVSFDTTLQVGAITESVQVTAAIEQLQTQNAKVVTAVTNKMVDELPLVVGGAMRGAFDLALVTPEANSPEDKGFNLGGAQGGSYGATLDGVSILTARFNSVEWANVNTPSVDALTEFAVETNGFKAVRTCAGRYHHVHVQVGHERTPWNGLRVPSQRRSRRTPLL